MTKIKTFTLTTKKGFSFEATVSREKEYTYTVVEAFGVKDYTCFNMQPSLSRLICFNIPENLSEAFGMKITAKMVTIMLSEESTRALIAWKESLEIDALKDQCTKTENGYYLTPFGYAVQEKDIAKAFKYGYDGIEKI